MLNKGKIQKALESEPAKSGAEPQSERATKATFSKAMRALAQSVERGAEARYPIPPERLAELQKFLRDRRS